MKQIVRAPSLEHASWLNHIPLSKIDLEGKIVLLDFFTYCCMNCLNILPDLKALEKEFVDELLVIGVHSAKHVHEKEDEAIKDALSRYKIEHCIINDADMKLWDAFGIKAWPSLVLIDTQGYVVSQYQGEGNFQELREDIWTLVEKDTLVQKNFLAEVSKQDRGIVHYPQQVLCSDDYLFISQMDEVLVCSYEGLVLHKLFLSEPQGMVYVNNKLYIASCLDGCIIEMSEDFSEQSIWLSHFRNPYGLESDGKHLFVSLAGAHQIKAFDLESKDEVLVIGQENSESLHDASFAEAILAQPSGIAFLEDELWFVDSESSSLRCASNDGVNSYIYDSDELQHPLDLCVGQYGDGCGGGRVFIADSYNNTVKVYNPQTKEVMHLIEGLAEPSGIDKKSCELYICNTNAHEVLIFDLSQMNLRRLELRNEN